MKLIPAFFVAMVLVSPAMAQQQPFSDAGDLSGMLQSLLNASGAAKQLVTSGASATVTNKSILGPTGELLPPTLATKQLRGQDYFEWCLRWNKQQYVEASRRATPATSLRGQVTRQSSFVQGSNSSGFFRRGGNSFRTASNSVTDSRQQLWKIGGNGGGPVAIYNPFISESRQVKSENGESKSR